MLLGTVGKSQPIKNVAFEGSNDPFFIEGLDVELDNFYGAWEKRKVTLFVRRGAEPRMKPYGISSSLRAGQKRQKDLRSESAVTAFRFRWIENGRTLYSELLEVTENTTFQTAYIQWVATTDGHPDSVGLAGAHRD